jgi:hypothetical protein
MNRVLIATFFAALIVALGAGWPEFGLEGRIVSQPEQAIGMFTKPLNLKGAIHYATPEQVHQYYLLQYISAGSLLVAIGAFLVSRRLEKKSGKPD